MSLRRRMLFIIGSMLILLVAVLYLVARFTILQGFQTLENAAMTDNLHRVTNVVQQELDSMLIMNTDWAHWDDTYAFMGGENDAYVEENLYDALIPALDLNLMVFIDNDAQIRWARWMKGEEIGDTLPEALVGSFNSTNPLLQLTESSTIQLDGLVAVDDDVLMVTARTISTNTGDAPMRGVLLMGRMLDPARVDAVAERLALNMEMLPRAAFDSSDETSAAWAELSNPDIPSYLKTGDSNTLAGYTSMNDVEASPVLLWRVTMPRGITQQGELSVSYFLLSLLGISAAMLLVLLLILERSIIARVLQLAEGVRAIRSNADLRKRLPVSGRDELASLGGAINEMLVGLERTQSLEEAVAFKSQILANVSHDARTPLSIILMRAEMLQIGAVGVLTDKQIELTQSIQNSARQLLNFFNNLLDAAQLDVGKLRVANQSVDLAPLVISVIDSLRPIAEKKSVILRTDIAEGLPHVQTDPERVRQILFNLVENALKFTDVGSVTVRLHCPTAAQWGFQVIDTGIGIPQAAESRLFEAFYQVDGSANRPQMRGVGLGLSIVKQLVDFMKGSIQLQSIEGKGTTFSVYFPMVV